METHCDGTIPDISLIVKGFVGFITDPFPYIFITMVKEIQKCREILLKMVDNTKAFRYNQLNENAISGILVTKIVTSSNLELFLQISFIKLRPYVIRLLVGTSCSKEGCNPQSCSINDNLPAEEG